MESGLALNLLLYLNNVHGLNNIHTIERKVKSLRIYDNTGCFFRLYYAAVTAISDQEAKGQVRVGEPTGKKPQNQKNIGWSFIHMLEFFSFSYIYVLIEKYFNQYKLFIILTGN